MPVHDCLPFYLAERLGIYARLGLDVRLKNYQAQLDIDTAIAKGHAEVAYSDLARGIMMQQDSVDVRAIASMNSELRLITARRGRIRKLEQLKEKMVAVARHSITDYWSDRLTDTASLARADIFRPQINNVRIRTDMLCNGTMDAAFLPEPYASETVLRGNNVNFTTKGLRPHLVVLLSTGAALKDPTRRDQITLLLQGYDQAVSLIGHEASVRDSLSSLVRSLCQAPDSLVDSLVLRLPRFEPLGTPERGDIEAVMTWLRSRDKIKKGYQADSLVHT